MLMLSIYFGFSHQISFKKIKLSFPNIFAPFIFSFVFDAVTDIIVKENLRLIGLL